MKTLFPIILTLVLSVPVFAGDVSVPGKQEPPPPCTENCATATASNGAVSFEDLILELLILAIVRG